MKEYKKNIISIIMSIILVLFIWHSFLTTGNNIIFVFIFIACYNILKKTLNIVDKRKNIIAIIIAVMFSIIEIVCKSINKDFTIDHIIDKWILINFIGYFIIAWILIIWIYNIFDDFQQKNNNRLSEKKLLNNNILLFVITFILILLAWTPYFLRYYPGIVTSDSYSQIEQGIGRIALQDHHPVAHTAIISVCVNLGLLIFNNINEGIAIYSILSMIIMALFDTSVLIYLKKKNAPPLIIGIILLYYMFYPVNAMYAITMWKDILFSGIIPIFLILCNELIFNTEKFFSNKINIIIFVSIAVLTMILRHNGLYVVIMTLPFIFIILKKHWKRVIPMFVTILVIYELFNVVIFKILKAEKGSIGEMLSIPLQQIARVEKKHRDDLDFETMENINKIFKSENIGEKYNPILSDPVKSEFNINYFNHNKTEFIKTWIKLFLEYPKDYIESFLSNSYGYYYVEAFSNVVSRATMDHNMGIEQQPKIQGKIVEKIDEIIDKRDIPLVSMIFSIGFGFWLMVVCLGYKIYTKNYKYILIYLPTLILWLTCIASPVFCEYRYAYPIFTTLPIYISLNFIRDKE